MNPTIKVLFPNGVERDVPASYNRLDPAVELGSIDHLRHVPTLRPDPMDGWSFHQLVGGAWLAVAESVAAGVRMEPRRFVPEEEDG